MHDHSLFMIGGVNNIEMTDYGGGNKRGRLCISWNEFTALVVDAKDESNVFCQK